MEIDFEISFDLGKYGFMNYIDTKARIVSGCPFLIRFRASKHEGGAHVQGTSPADFALTKYCRFY